MAFNPARENSLGAGQFDHLISQLRAQNSGATATSQQASQFPQTSTQNNTQYYNQQAPNHSYQPPSVSSPLPTPPSQRIQSRQSSSIMSPSNEAAQGSVAPQSSADRTASLLNLLKFSGPGSNQAAPISLPQTTSTISEGRSSFGAVPHQASADGRNTPGTDLIAALMGNPYSKQPSQSQSSSRTPSASFRAQQAPPPQDTQNFLLQLLNRPKPPQTNASPPEPAAVTGQTPQSKEASISDVADLSKALERSSLENASRDSGKKPAPIIFGSALNSPDTPAKNLFTYQNPFEELARSSPRNRAPKKTAPVESSVSTPAMQILKHPRNNPSSEIDGYERKSAERGQTDSPAYTKRKLDTPNPPSPVPLLPDGRTEIEALMGIGATNKDKETVSEALNEVGEKVNKQVEAALLEAEESGVQEEIERDMKELMNAKTDEEFEASAQIAAKAIKKELDKNGNEHLLEDSLPTSVADVVKELIEETAQGHVADSWESADAEDIPTKEGESYVVKVYNFPMKPFASLTVDIPAGDRTAIRLESAMSIARLKKDFDQIDRTLVTATDTFMIYCMPKTGGIRIIHQGNGNNSKLFSNHDDRIFSISASTSGETEAILGTGVSNTVYWAVISHGEYDEDFLPETKSFALPPLQSQDGDSPGGLKTRARKSGSHTEFFALGRGKSIYIIQPNIILKDKSYFANSDERIVDTEKYLSDHAMVINTGKAGKDFTFSPDDSIIVSLDKTGKVKVWDVRPFTSKWVPSETSVKSLEFGEIKEPMMTLMTSSPSEKSWATSVMFVDKAKPYQKGGPLRYLIIGMKQNHTLQLWDLALGKVVQELNLPHEKESDAACSVLYHPHTSIIVVGHPTRNSIYFIHLSSPKYNLSRAQNQAEYITALVSRDPSFSKPDSTAVMSGVREFSFSTPDRGVLRSLEILQQPTSCNPSSNEPVLFELYAMHSKGLTCISIKQEDLGWSPDNRVLHPVDAEKAGVVKVEGLQAMPTIPSSEPTGEFANVRATSHRQPVKETAVRDTGKKVSSARERVDRKQSSEIPAAVRTISPVTKSPEKLAPKANGGIPESSSGIEKPTRSRKKKNATSTDSPRASQVVKGESSTVEHPTLLTRNGSSTKVQKSPEQDGTLANAAIEASKPHTPQPTIDQQAIDAVVKSLEDRIAPEIVRAIRNPFEDLYKRLDDDRRVQAAASDVKQEAILRLVSNGLGQNVHATLEHAVRESLENQILPAILGMTSSALNDQFGSKLTTQINKVLPKELHSVLPDAVTKAFQKPALLNSVSNSITGTLIGRVESQLVATLEDSIMPTFSRLVSQTAQTIVEEAQQHYNAQLTAFTHQHNRDNAQIAQLSQLVTNLSNTVSTMADVQAKFQDEFLKFQRQISQSRRPTPSNTQSAVARTPVQDNAPADEQLDRAIRAVQTAIHANELEAAVVAWLQSGREEQIFRSFFSKLTHLEWIIEPLSPLVLLSVGCVVTNDLVEFEPEKKLDWVEKILQCFPTQPGYLIPLASPSASSRKSSLTSSQDDRIRAVLPNTMMVIETRLDEHFNRISNESRGQSPLLRRIAGMLTLAQHIRNVYGLPAPN